MEFINKILSGLKIQGTGKLKLCLVDSKARTVQERLKQVRKQREWHRFW